MELLSWACTEHLTKRIFTVSACDGKWFFFVWNCTTYMGNLKGKHNFVQACALVLQKGAVAPVHVTIQECLNCFYTTGKKKRHMFNSNGKKANAKETAFSFGAIDRIDPTLPQNPCFRSKTVITYTPVLVAQPIDGLEADLCWLLVCWYFLWIIQLGLPAHACDRRERSHTNQQNDSPMNNCMGSKK